MRYFGHAVSLCDGPAVVDSYKKEHQHAWLEVVARLREIGITEVRVFLLGRHLFMYMETRDGFEPARDHPRLNDDPRYREWDELMKSMQEKVPEAGANEWWADMEPVFDLNWPQYRGE